MNAAADKFPEGVFLGKKFTVLGIGLNFIEHGSFGFGRHVLVIEELINSL